MAENKKSFIAYVDWGSLFKRLSDVKAGKLAKHLFAYVNDENPVSDEDTEAYFELIKLQLKRDLEKYENIVERNRENGKKGGRPSKPKKPTGLTGNPKEPKKADNDNDIYNKLLSEIDISDVDENLKDYFIIAKEFQRLFIKNLTEKEASTIHQEKATFKKYVDPIRLMLENKECTVEELRDVFNYLYSSDGEFWKANILSTSKLREKITVLTMQSRKQKAQAL